MRVHLDPVGGVAGDMFIAACVDAWPALHDDVVCIPALLGAAEGLETKIHRHHDDILTGCRFSVHQAADSGHRHVGFTTIRDLIGQADLSAGTRARAIAIFDLLAHAESTVHGTSKEDVTFHEVGGWDSIVDVVGAALIIERLGAQTWTVGAIPLGSGRVSTAHGMLPVPAPATMVLLDGMVTHADGIEGERVTPTGAAILRHLQPEYLTAMPPVRLRTSGIAFGSRSLKGISNILRVTGFEDVAAVGDLEDVVVMSFEIDDQTPEDLSIALDAIRETVGVLDVIHIPSVGKRGRMTAHVQVLARPEHRAAVLESCFYETTTLGIRWHDVRRAALHRTVEPHSDGEKPVRVKVAPRPHGGRSAKADVLDVTEAADGYADRQSRRRTAQAAALTKRER